MLNYWRRIYLLTFLIKYLHNLRIELITHSQSQSQWDGLLESLLSTSDQRLSRFSSSRRRFYTHCSAISFSPFVFHFRAFFLFINKYKHRQWQLESYSLSFYNNSNNDRFNNNNDYNNNHDTNEEKKKLMYFSSNNNNINSRINCFGSINTQVETTSKASIFTAIWQCGFPKI